MKKKEKMYPTIIKDSNEKKIREHLYSCCGDCYSDIKTAFILIMVVIVSLISGYCYCKATMHKEIVNHGFGYYDDSSYFKTFNWYTTDELIKFYTKEAEE